MGREPGPQTVLPYATPRPRPKAPRPAFFAEVGCASSVVGAVLLGVALPWWVARGFEYDGAPSLVGGAMGMLFAAGEVCSLWFVGERRTLRCAGRAVRERDERTDVAACG